MPIQSSLGSLLQPFNQQSPMNLMAAIAQLGISDPAQLAQLMSSAGARPPIGAGEDPSSPQFGSARTQGTLQAPQTPPSAIRPTAPAALPTLAPPPPTPPPTSPTASVPGGAGTQPGEGLLTALSALKPPGLPPIAPPPAAIAPEGAGPAPDPRLLAQLLQLLQGAQGPTVPTLGQLIAGKATPTPAARPTLSL